MCGGVCVCVYVCLYNFLKVIADYMNRYKVRILDRRESFNIFSMSDDSKLVVYLC